MTSHQNVEVATKSLNLSDYLPHYSQDELDGLDDLDGLDNLYKEALTDYEDSPSKNKGVL